MSDRDQDSPERDKESGVSPLDSALSQDEPLLYRIELWDIDDSNGVERVLARAATAPVARAIYDTARKEHPQHRITLCRGVLLLADSSPGGPPRTH